jgi:hypothetical protein
LYDKKNNINLLYLISKNQLLMKKFRQNASTLSAFLSLTVLFASCTSDMESSPNLSTLNADFQPVVNNASAMRMADRYSGEELFKSVYFAYGNFARTIPSYRELVASIEEASPEQHRIFNERYARFVNSVSRRNPEFFRRFKEGILSGDHARIRDTFVSGADMIYDNIEIISPELIPLIEEFKNDEELKALSARDADITQEDIDYINTKYERFLSENYQLEVMACSWAVACVAYFALAVHNTVGVTVNIAAVAAIYFKVALWGPKLDSHKKGKIISHSVERNALQFEMFIQEVADASAN